MADGARGIYSISVVAELTCLHQQTIRQYERLGLIKPKRSAGGTRTFSENDVALLQSIASLTRDMGVNLAGVDVILRMREREQQLVTLIREVFQYLDEPTRARIEALIRGDEPGLVQLGKQELAVRKPKSKR